MVALESIGVAQNFELRQESASQASALPGAEQVLQLLQSECVVRAGRASGEEERQRLPPRKIRYVLERMSLANLVSLMCSTMSDRRFPKLIAQELKVLRETALILQA